MAIEWHKTNFVGVRYRKHDTRKEKPGAVKYDQYYEIRFQVDGKTYTEALGWATEGWTAQKAFEQRNKLKSAAKSGEGPATIKEQRRQTAIENEKAPTFEETVAEFLTKYRSKKGKPLRPKTHRYYKDGLNKVAIHTPIKNAGPLGEWKLKDIKKKQLAQLIEDTIETSASVATQIYKSLSSMYTWAAESAREYIETNIIRDIKSPPKSPPRKRFLNDDEIGICWNALQVANGDPAMARCVQFAMIAGARISEACGMTTDEIDGDWWTIPAERFKGDRDHRVYLTDTAKGIIGDFGPVVFPSERGKGKPFAEASCSHWIKDNNCFGLKHFSCHDFRRTLGTGLQKLQTPHEHISATIGHAFEGVTAVHYMHYDYADEKMAALIKWEAHVLTCAEEARKAQ